MEEKNLIIVRGGGDLATGVIHTLWKNGYRILILETHNPSAIRRKVAFSEAIYNGEMEVEGARAELITKEEDETWDTFYGKMELIWSRNAIPILVDPLGQSITELKPLVVIDAIIAKKNLGTHKDMAPVTIALGPGFCAGVDVHYVIETMRGETLGEVITEGYALENTGIPGEVAGVSKERVIHASAAGILRNVKSIGDIIHAGEMIAYIEKESENICYEIQHVPVHASIDGVLRGLIRDGYPVRQGFKIADIDPRLEEQENCDKISDKARCLGESVYNIFSLTIHSPMIEY